MSPKKKPYKKIPRSKLKYPGLDVRRAAAIRREELECDYLDKIKHDPALMKFLNQFNEEHVNANLGKKDDPEAKAKLLDKSPEGRKYNFDRNNARNRDILARAKVRNLVTRVESDSHLSHFVDNDNTHYNHHEDTMVALIDESRKEPEED